MLQTGLFEEIQMSQNYQLSRVNFGQPEAEHDLAALQDSFYEADSWKAITASRGTPFVIGRKGSGKSAVAARLEILAKQNPGCCCIRFVPANFRHVEIRDLLAALVNKNTSWQYIYRKVWEGIILGQVVGHLSRVQLCHNSSFVSQDMSAELLQFEQECGFYVRALDDALSDVITNYVRDASKKTEALSQVELRKMLEPYDWKTLSTALETYFRKRFPDSVGMVIAIDGLDEHWDTSAPSLYFLAELLAVIKTFTAKYGSALQFVICLRDNIFRALVDTRSIEYDKIESLIINLEWSSFTLFELIARRVAPKLQLDFAVDALRDMLPESVQGIAVEEYLARHILQRPRDYINFFRMLQKECGSEPRAGEGHVQDTTAKYRANRLVDLENEFGSIYPGISQCITELHPLPETFSKEKLLEELSALCMTPSFRAKAPLLMEHYGQPLVLARILLSVGVVGTYDKGTHALRFVHEFSESRVQALWDSAMTFGIHPVYGQKRTSITPNKADPVITSTARHPAIVVHPADYLAEKDSLNDLENITDKLQRKSNDLLAQLAAIDRGQGHFRRYEIWVKDTISFCFMGDLINAEEQITTGTLSKKFEMIFDIVGNQPPWQEVRYKYNTHRLLVECKNTDDPTDADFSKLHRDMQALDIRVAFMAYRGNSREPQGKMLDYQRSIYNNSKRESIILTLSDVFFKNCLAKKLLEKRRQNMNTLWRDHLERWLPS